jgi:hypothetical protein
VTTGGHAHHTSFVDQQLDDRRVGPDAHLTSERGAQRLADQGRAVAQERLALQARADGTKRHAARGAHAHHRTAHELELCHLAGEHDDGREPRRQLPQPGTEVAAVEDRRLDRAPTRDATLDAAYARVVVAVALATDERQALVLEEAHHVGAFRDVRGTTFRGGRGPGVTDDRVEVRHRVVERVGHTFGLHERVVREP